MAPSVVADAGPLISLSAIGQFSLLRTLFGTLLIPAAVAAEIFAGAQGDPGVEDLQKADWISTGGIQDRLAVEILRNELDPVRGHTQAGGRMGLTA